MSLRRSSDSPASFLRVESTNFFALVLTELFTALFRILRSSLWRCRFSADLTLLDKNNLQLSIAISQNLAHVLENVKALFKIRRPPFDPFAFITFGLVFNLAVFKNCLHFDFAPAGTQEFLGCRACTRVLTGLSHSFLLAD
jgi:hypothetical protein